MVWRGTVVMEGCSSDGGGAVHVLGGGNKVCTC